MGGVIADGQLWVAIPLSLLAGLVSFASPCVLPLVPGYLGYVTGSSAATSRWRPMIGVTLFILGFTLVFVAYGAAFGSLGAWLIRWQDLMTRILGVVVILMGLVFIGLFQLFQRTAKPAITRPATDRLVSPSSNRNDAMKGNSPSTQQPSTNTAT